MSQPGLCIKPDGLWRLGKCHDCPPLTPGSPDWTWHFTLPEAQGLSHLGLTPRLQAVPQSHTPQNEVHLSVSSWGPSVGPRLPLLPLMLILTSYTSLCDFNGGLEAFQLLPTLPPQGPQRPREPEPIFQVLPTSPNLSSMCPRLHFAHNDSNIMRRIQHLLGAWHDG